MVWVVLFHEAFEPEFAMLEESVQDDLLGALEVLSNSDLVPADRR
jgi:hypothetical protein